MGDGSRDGVLGQVWPETRNVKKAGPLCLGETRETREKGRLTEYDN